MEPETIRTFLLLGVSFSATSAMGAPTGTEMILGLRAAGPASEMIRSVKRVRSRKSFPMAMTS